MNGTDKVSEIKELEEKLKYPKGVFFIVVTAFFERFSFFGLQCILILYLRNVLSFNDTTSKILFHTFNSLVYACPILGGVIADSWLGKFNTIIITGLVNVCGLILVSLSSTKLIITKQAAGILIGFTLIAVGSGCTRPCVTPFGGDQFMVPEQTQQLHGYFTIFYFVVMAASFTASITVPQLKEKVHCFEEKTCYSLAFGVSGISLAIALSIMFHSYMLESSFIFYVEVIFGIGKPFYKILKPQKNVVTQWIKCVGLGLKMKIKSKEPANHWLDRCEDKFGLVFVNDVKITLNVLFLFIPAIFFWALYDQQWSGWTLLANKMYTVDVRRNSWNAYLPEQMIVVHTFFALIFVPVFSCCLYPLCAHCRLFIKLLPRMTCGGLLTALSFMIAANISLLIECDEPKLPQDGECHLRIYNPLSCTVQIDVPPYIVNKKIKSMKYEKIIVKDVKGEHFLRYTVTGCEDVFLKNVSGNRFRIAEKKALGYYFTDAGLKYFKDNIEKHRQNLAKLRLLIGYHDSRLNNTHVVKGWRTRLKSLRLNAFDHSLQIMVPGEYPIGKFKISLYPGGVYTLLVAFDGKGITNLAIHEITKHNSIHILWLFPQYIVLAAGSVMITVSGNEFASTQAPKSMKAVMSAAWILTSSLGNITVIIVEVSSLFHKQSSEFFMFSGLMIVAIGVFGCLAKNYKYVQHRSR